MPRAPLLNRREALAVLASTAVLSLLPACRRTSADAPGASAAASPATNAEGTAAAMLDQIGDNFLKMFPESATSLGIDTGARALLRSRLTDRSADGQKKIADQVRQDLNRARAISADGPSHATRSSVDVVRSAYTTALEGF